MYFALFHCVTAVGLPARRADVGEPATHEGREEDAIPCFELQLRPRRLTGLRVAGLILLVAGCVLNPTHVTESSCSRHRDAELYPGVTRCAWHARQVQREQPTLRGIRLVSRQKACTLEQEEPA